MDLLWQMVTTLVILATAGYVECQTPSTQDPICLDNSTCPCCINTSCPTDGSGQCGGNCKDGYHSGKCYDICPYNCIRCVDALQGGGVSNCTLCRDGHYSTETLYQCQSKCPNNCKTCEANGTCAQCKDGYYSTTSLYQCQSACSSYCKTCVSNASYCTSCQDGYFLSESFQCTACNETCSACTSYSYCTSCWIGHFLDERDGICHKCNSLCLHCDSPQTCVCYNGCAAISGFQNLNCMTETGDCIYGCRANFTSSIEYYTCDRCIVGNFGINCDLSCPQTCSSIGCDRLDGVCFACKVGFFGDYCNMTCPQNCRSECDRTTGQCDSCKNGFYGGECTIECVTNCDSCTMVNGSCMKCADGFFGLSCTNHCSENCLNGKCNMDNGSCLCVPGYMGPVCENKITTTNKYGIGPPLVVSATPQNYVGATVGITLTAVVIVAVLVGLGVWCFKTRINGAGRRNFPVFGMTVNMSDIDKLEGQLSRIDKELNKWTSRRSEVASKLEGLKANIPYRNTGNFPVFGMTVNMSDIDKLEGKLSRIDKELNKWTSRREEVESKLEELKANIPYRNTDRADKVEDRSYEMLQKERSESPYSSIQ